MFRKTEPSKPTIQQPPPDPIKINIPDPIVPALPGTTLHVVTSAEDTERLPVVAWRVNDGVHMVPLTADSAINRLIKTLAHVGIAFFVDDGHHFYDLLHIATRDGQDRNTLQYEIAQARNHIHRRNQLLSERTGHKNCSADTDRRLGWIKTWLPNLARDPNEEELAAIVKHHGIRSDCTMLVNGIHYKVVNGYARKDY